MSYTALQGTPIFVNLLTAANDTGWQENGSIATHSSCNAGFLRLSGYALTVNTTYTAVFQVISITSGYIQFTLGGVSDIAITAPGFYSFTATATNTNDTNFYANGNCSVELFSLQTNPVPISPYQQNTIAFSDSNNTDNGKTDKWGAWYTKVPDIGTSLFEKTYEINQGAAYISEHGSNDRCNFFGVSYPATIIFSTNQQPTTAKTYSSINYQCNMLLVSPSLIATSLGQQSELISLDFVQEQYNNGQVGYTTEGIYKASFLRDSNVDLINGPILQGNWMTVGLQTASTGVMNLYTTEIIYAHSYNNAR